MITVQEYLSNEDTVRKAVDELINKPVAQMVKFRKSGNNLDILINDYENDSSMIEPDYIKGSIRELTFLDVLALLRDVKSDYRYDFGYPKGHSLGKNRITCVENYLNYVRMLLSFFMVCTTEKENRTEYMFGKFKLKDLYMLKDDRGGLENKWDYRKLCEAYKTHMIKYGNLYSSSERDKLNEDTTVREFITHCNYMTHICWIPACDDPEMYIKGIRSAYELTGKFLVEYFTVKYRSMYDLEDIKSRILKPADSDFIELDDLIPEFCDLEDVLPFD